MLTGGSQSDVIARILDLDISIPFQHTVASVASNDSKAFNGKESTVPRQGQPRTEVRHAGSPGPVHARSADLPDGRRLPRHPAARRFQFQICQSLLRWTFCGYPDRAEGQTQWIAEAHVCVDLNANTDGSKTHRDVLCLKKYVVLSDNAALWFPLLQVQECPPHLRLEQYSITVDLGNRVSSRTVFPNRSSTPRTGFRPRLHGPCRFCIHCPGVWDVSRSKVIVQRGITRGPADAEPIAWSTESRLQQTLSGNAMTQIRHRGQSPKDRAEETATASGCKKAHATSDPLTCGALPSLAFLRLQRLHILLPSGHSNPLLPPGDRKSVV